MISVKSPTSKLSSLRQLGGYEQADLDAEESEFNLLTYKSFLTY